MRFVAGLLFGSLFGATTAVLLAPSSGRQLRSSLSKEAKKLAVRATGLVPKDWTRVAEEEITREILDNVASLRSAGL